MGSPEQRRFARRSLTVEFYGRDLQGQGQMVFEGADLSAGGAFLKSDLLLETGETLEVEFRVPGIDTPLKAQARVAWVRRFPEADELPGMGIAFLAMAEQDRRALDDYLRAIDSPLH